MGTETFFHFPNNDRSVSQMKENLEALFQNLDEIALKLEQHEADARREIIAVGDRLMKICEKCSTSAHTSTFTLEEMDLESSVYGYLSVGVNGFYLAYRSSWDDYFISPEDEVTYDTAYPETWSAKWLREAARPERIKELSEKLYHNIEGLIDSSANTVHHTRKLTQCGLRLVEQDVVSSSKKYELPNVAIAWGKAHKLIHSDPSAAITAASSLLETTIKHLLVAINSELPKAQSIRVLYSELKKKANPLFLAGDDQEKIRGLIHSLSSAVENIGGIRTQIGDAHGKGPSQRGGSSEEAMLAVSAAGTICSFLVCQVGKLKRC